MDEPDQGPPVPPEGQPEGPTGQFAAPEGHTDPFVPPGAAVGPFLPPEVPTGQFAPPQAAPGPFGPPAFQPGPFGPPEVHPGPFGPPPSSPVLPPPGARTGGPRAWLRWAVPAGALVVGLVAGGVTVAVASDPTRTDEYRALEQGLDEAHAEIDRAEGRRRTAEEASRTAEENAQRALEEAAGRERALDAREEGLVTREQAVTATEQRIAATSIGQGIWTVGVDVEPGTYRTERPVGSDCYWGIYASGTNGDDIIQNDIVTGGYPTVTLRPGQDFENNRCGTFVKQ